MLNLTKMSLEEKMQNFELLWQDLSQSNNLITQPSWHYDVLQTREQEFDNNQLIDWQQVKKNINQIINEN